MPLKEILAKLLQNLLNPSDSDRKQEQKEINAVFNELFQLERKQPQALCKKSWQHDRSMIESLNKASRVIEAIERVTLTDFYLWVRLRLSWLSHMDANLKDSNETEPKIYNIQCSIPFRRKELLGLVFLGPKRITVVIPPNHDVRQILFQYSQEKKDRFEIVGIFQDDSSQSLVQEE